MDLSALDGYANSTYPGCYAGITIAGRAVIVHRTTELSAQFDEDISTRFDVGELVFSEALHSRQTLKDVAAVVLRDIDEWRAMGVDILAVSVPSDGSRVQIGTPNPEVAAGRVTGRYGGDLVEVVEWRGSVPLAGGAGRIAQGDA